MLNRYKLERDCRFSVRSDLPDLSRKLQGQGYPQGTKFPQTRRPGRYSRRQFGHKYCKFDRWLQWLGKIHQHQLWLGQFPIPETNVNHHNLGILILTEAVSRPKGVVVAALDIHPYLVVDDDQIVFRRRWLRPIGSQRPICAIEVIRHD